MLANDKVTFFSQKGVRHTNKVFGGSWIKVVKMLSDNGQEVVEVFRSRNKS